MTLFTIFEEKKKDCEEEATQGSFFKLGNKLSNSCFQSSEACFQSSNSLPEVTLSLCPRLWVQSGPLPWRLAPVLYDLCVQNSCKSSGKRSLRMSSFRRLHAASPASLVPCWSLSCLSTLARTLVILSSNPCIYRWAWIRGRGSLRSHWEEKFQQEQIQEWREWRSSTALEVAHALKNEYRSI